MKIPYLTRCVTHLQSRLRSWNDERHKLATTPLSAWAKEKIKDLPGVIAPCLMVALVSVVAILVDHNRPEELTQAPRVLAATITLFWGIIILTTGPRRWRDKRRILRTNVADYAIAQRLREPLAALEALSHAPWANCQPPLPGRWRPFRIEHLASSTIAAQTAAELAGRVMLGHLRAHGTSTTMGLSIPHAFDDTTVLFCVNDQADTLRVILPSPSLIRHLIAQTVRASLGGIRLSSHTGALITGFAMPQTGVELPLPSASFVDRLDAQLHRAVGNDALPLLTIFGEENGGIALASAVLDDRTTAHFLPVGFLRLFAATVEGQTGSHPQLMA